MVMKASVPIHMISKTDGAITRITISIIMPKTVVMIQTLTSIFAAFCRSEDLIHRMNVTARGAETRIKFRNPMAEKAMNTKTPDKKALKTPMIIMTMHPKHPRMSLIHIHFTPCSRLKQKQYVGGRRITTTRCCAGTTGCCDAEVARAVLVKGSEQAKARSWPKGLG